MDDRIKEVQPNIVFDLVNPNKDMFTRDGEVPNAAILAVHPNCSDTVGIACKKVLYALAEIMKEPEHNLMMMQQDAIEMESGDVMTLSEDSLVMSLMYDKGDAKLLHLELTDANSVTIH